MQAIANNPAPPTFENTIVAHGEERPAARPRDGGVQRVSPARTSNPDAAEGAETSRRRSWPRTRTRSTSIQAVRSASRRSTSSALRSSSIRNRCGWSSIDYKQFVQAGANLSEADKAKLKKLNEEESTLANAFITKLLAATKDGAFVTTDKSALAGLSDAQIAAAAQAAKERK